MPCLATAFSCCFCDGKHFDIKQKKLKVLLAKTKTEICF